MKKVFDKAIEFQKKGDFEGARSCYEILLKEVTYSYDYLYGRALLEVKSSNIDEAIKYYERINNIKSNSHEIIINLAILYQEIKNNDRALEYYKKYIEIVTDNKFVYNNVGNILSEIHDYNEANFYYIKALEIDNYYEDVIINYANNLFKLGDIEKSLVFFNKCLDINPSNYLAYFNKGLIYHANNDLSKSLESYNKSIKINNNNEIIYFNRGNIYLKQNRYMEAIQDYDNALRLNNQYDNAYANKGDALKFLRNYNDAIKNYNEAIKLNPMVKEYYNNLGVVYDELRDFAKAIIEYKMAIKIDSKYKEAYFNLANAYKELNQIDDSIMNYDEAIRLDETYYDAQWNKSLILLLIGNYKEGFKLFEKRWDVIKNKLQYKNYNNKPIWLGGESLQGKRILIHSEQGLGDTIQFSRYAELLKKKGAYVVLEVPSSLKQLLTNIEGVNEVIEESQDYKNIDFHCPMMSLPFAFNTNINNIPNTSKYIYSDKKLVEKWKKILGPKTKFRIGLVWNGGFRKNQPELWSVNERRNIELSKFLKFNQIDAEFISLQKGEQAETELKKLQKINWKGPIIKNYSNLIKTFSDTAAIVENIDLVISVDTSTAHLSAAMGKETWILNRKDTCWRWLLERNDSPWYDSVKIYRQLKEKSWEEPIEKVVNDLRKKISN